MRERRLRTFLVLLLVATTLTTLGVVSSTLLAIRLHQIAGENLAAARRQADELAARVEIQLSSMEDLLELHGKLLAWVTRADLSTLLDSAVRPEGPFEAVYVISADARVIAAGVTPRLRMQREELLGSDFSANRLYREVQAVGAATWSGKFLSALTGEVAVGLAVPAGERVVVGELALDDLLHTVQVAAGDSEVSTWVIDQSGEVVADTQTPRNVGVLNLSGLKIVRAALEGAPLPRVFEYHGGSYHPAVTHSESLNWYFLVRMPAGLDNPRIRSTTVLVVSGFAGTMLIGLLLAPLWASRMARPMRAIIDRARRMAAGRTDVGWPRGPIAEFNDLSIDLERMAAAIRERELRFHSIFNASPVAMAVVDRQTQALMDVNDAWVALLGYPRDEMVGRTTLQIGLYPSVEERNRVLEAFDRQQDHYETQMLTREGNQLTIKVSARSMRLESKDLRIHVLDDVTEKRRIDQELQRHRAQLEVMVEERTRELRAAQSELVQAERLATIGQLTATVSHELRNPLGTIQASVESLGMLADSDDRREKRVLERLRRNVARCVRIIDELLDFTRNRPLRVEAVAVDDWCRSVIADLAAPEECETVLRCNSGGVAMIDRDRFGQALVNVLQNAWQALRHERTDAVSNRVVVETRLLDGRVQIRVTDNGEGIGETDRERIFEPLFSTKMFGVGLGLPLVKRILAEHSGEIAVESVLHQGTTVTLTVPAADALDRASSLTG